MLTVVAVHCIAGDGTGPSSGPKKGEKAEQTAGGKAQEPGEPKGELKQGVNLMALPIPIGGDAKQIKIPYFTPEGLLKMQFEAEVAKRVEEKTLLLDNLKVDLYDDQGKKDMSINLPKSKFDLETQILTSEDPVSIERKDFRLEGETMTFDSRIRKGKLVGQVRMVIFDRASMK